MTEQIDYCHECGEIIRIGLDEEHSDYRMCNKCLEGERNKMTNQDCVYHSSSRYTECGK